MPLISRLLNTCVALAGMAPALFASGVPSYQWHTFYNNTVNNVATANATAVDQYGNVYIAGTCGQGNECWPGSIRTPGANDASNRNYVLKLNPAGQHLWHTFFSNGYLDGGTAAIALDPSGNVYVAGMGWPDGNNPKSNGGGGAYVIALDTNGAYRWHTTFGGFATAIAAYGIAYDALHDRIYVTGYADSDFCYSGYCSPVIGYPGHRSMYVSQFEPDGNAGWYAFFSGGYDRGQAIAVDSAENVYVAGQASNNLTVWKLHYVPPTLVTPANVNVLWETVYSTPGQGYPTSMALDGTGSIYVAGNGGCFNGPLGEPALNPSRCNGYALDMFALKMNTSGAYQWHTSYHPSNGGGTATAIALDGLNRIYVTGQAPDAIVAPAQPLHGSSSGHYLLQLDASGAYQWHTIYGDGASGDTSQSMAVDAAHEVYVCGMTNGPWYGDNTALPLQAWGGVQSIFAMKFAPPPVATTTTASAVNLNFSPGAQAIALTATVTSASGTVTGGSVSFTLLGTTVTGNLIDGSASAAFTVPGGTHAGSYAIQAAYSGATGFSGSADATKLLSISKVTPSVAWANPADIYFGTALGASQLNATASVAGLFAYSPAAGTVLPVGNGQTLSAAFTPGDTTDYYTTTASASINVKALSPPASPAQLAITKTLARNATNNEVTVTLSISNSGGTTAQSAQLTIGRIGALSGTPLPQALGNLAPGGVVKATLRFAPAVGNPGVAAALTIGGTYSGGSFNSASKITLP